MTRHGWIRAASGTPVGRVHELFLHGSYSDDVHMAAMKGPKVRADKMCFALAGVRRSSRCSSLKQRKRLRLERGSAVDALSKSQSSERRRTPRLSSCIPPVVGVFCRSSRLVLSALFRVILDEAAETGLEAADDDTGDVALLSPNKMETLGEIRHVVITRHRVSCTLRTSKLRVCLQQQQGSFSVLGMPIWRPLRDAKMETLGRITNCCVLIV